MLNNKEEDKKNVSNYKEIKNLWEEIKKSLIEGKDKTDEMKRIIVIFEDIISKDSLEDYFNEKDLKNFSTIISSILETILKQSYVHGENGDDIALELLFQIYRIFSKFHKNKKYSEIFESIRNQFKNHTNLIYFFPHNKINKPGDLNVKKNIKYKEFNERFCRDFICQESPELLFNEGERVDILVKHKESQSFIDDKAWVRGIIKKIENGKYYIEYNGEENEICLPVGSQQIQPEGRKTVDWEWRTNLKKYSLVDIYNGEHWLPCTICDIEEELEKDEIKRVKYRIGFRLYKNHFKNEEDSSDKIENYFSFYNNGNTYLDENKQEYIGLSRDNDIKLFHFSKRIQKFYSYSEIEIQSKEGGDLDIVKSVNNELAKEDIPEIENIDDFFYYEKDNKKNIIIGKLGNFSFYYAYLLKKIEYLGDFDNFIDIIKDKPNKEEILTIFTILLSSLDYIHNKYILENRDIFKKAFKDYINNSDDKEIKNLDNYVDLPIRFLKKIYKIQNNLDEKEIEKTIEDEILLTLAFRKIKTIYFDKRIEGIKFIDGILNKRKNDEQSISKICILIKENKLLNEIFGPNYHSQIISKSAEMVKLLIKNKILNEDDINLIWGCTQKGDTEVRRTIINLFMGLLQHYDEDFLGVLFNSLVNISDGKPNEQEIDFVHKLSLITKSEENKKKICKYFCKSIFGLDTFSKNNPVFDKLLIMMTHDDNYLIQVLKICEENIKVNKYTLICNSLIIALFDKFIISNNNKNNQNSINDSNPAYICIKDSLSDFMGDNHLLDIFEKNFTDYMDKAREIYENENLSSRDEIIIDGFSHSRNIDGRLSFLNKLITYYPQYDFFPKIKELLLDYPVVPEDKMNFFQFIQSYCFPSKEYYENETRNKIRIELFDTLTEMDQNEMTYKEFRLFVLLFFNINSKIFDFQIIKRDDDNEEYIIKVKPNKEKEEIDKLDELWKIIYETNNDKIINKLIFILYEIQENKQDILDNIAATMEGEEDKEKIQKCYKLLELFLIESEKNFVSNIKSHYSLLRNCIIKFPLEIINKDNNNHLENKNENKVELFYDNSTLIDIKEEIAKKFKIPRDFIEVYKIIGEKEIQLDYSYNYKSLKELVLDDINFYNRDKNININNIIIFKTKQHVKKDLIINNEPTGYNNSIENNKNENSELFRFKLCNEEDEFMKAFIENYNKYPEIDYNFFFFFPTKENIYKEILEKFTKDLEIFNNIFKEDSNILRQLYYLIIIESFLQDIEISYIEPTQIFKNTKNSNQILCSKKYIPFENYDINDKKNFFIDFINNKVYENLIDYIIYLLEKYKKSKNEVMKKCCKKGLKIIKILFEACIDIDLKNNLIEENIYFLDYSYIKNIFKDKQQIKEMVRNYSYSLLFKKLNKFLTDNINDIDDLYNECFDTVIKLLAYKDIILNNIMSDEDSKQSFYNLINKLQYLNSAFFIKSLKDTLEKIFSIPSYSNNKFIEFINYILESIINSFSNDDNNLFSSEGFAEFFIQINDLIYNKQSNPNNKLLLKIIESIINDIYEKNNKEKKLPISIFIKYIKLIIKLIEKNSKIKQQILSYKINDKTLCTSLLEKIILNSKEDGIKIEENNNIIQKQNDGNKFIQIEKEDDEDSIENELKNTCLNYIFEMLKSSNDINAIKEIINLNKILKHNLENKENNNESISKNNNKEVNSFKNSKKVCGHVGLKNLGSICYMNSVLQQLYMVPTFRYAIMGSDDKIIPDPSSAKIYGPKDDNLLHQLQVMFTYLNLSEEKFFIPNNFCYSYKDYDGNPTNPKMQQDCQEFYSNFLDKMEKCLTNTKYKYIINDVFMGKSCSSVICKSCKYVSNRFEDSYYLSLEVNNINNLKDSLRKFIKPEPVEGFKCEGCQKYVSIEKRTTLYKLPNTLFIHLKRFSMDYELGIPQKIVSIFNFPPQIDLKQYCVEFFQKHEKNDIYFKNDEYYKYILKGIVVHLGNAGGGHYISLIDIERDGKGNTMKYLKTNEKSKWLRFNDSNLSNFDYSYIPSECYGGENVDSFQCAYLLIYERVEKTPIRIIIDKDEISEKQKKNIINYKNNEENDINIKYDISKINNDIKEEELYKLIFHKEESNEYYKYIPFYNISKNCPKEIYNRVMEENKLLSKKNVVEKEKIVFDKKEQNKLKNLIYSEILNKNIIGNLNITEIIDLINLVLFDIFQILNKNNLTQEEIEEINRKMDIVINNLINPLINKNIDIKILKTIQKAIISENNIEKIFPIKEPVFKSTIIHLIYNIIINLIKEYISRGILLDSDIFNTIVKYLKNIKSNPKYKGSKGNESHPIKYIYSIIYEILSNETRVGVEGGLVCSLMSGIENECSLNQQTIIKILNIIIKFTQEYKKLYNFQSDILSGVESKIDNKYKIKNIILQKDVIDLFYQNYRDIFIILLKILEYGDSNFSKKFNLQFIPYLLEQPLRETNKSIKFKFFIDLCFNLISIKDNYCLERMKQLLGFPVMIVETGEKNENSEENKKTGQKLPLFGYELIINNNNDIKTEIYKYECFYKKNKFCLLSYFLPYSKESNEKTDIQISNDEIKNRIIELLLMCLSNGGNYYLFKYLYLLPARNICYKNAYEELVSIISENSSFTIKNFSNTEKILIDKINYELNIIYQKENPNNINFKNINKPELPKEISENNPDIKSISEFMGFQPDFIPGEIVKEEIESLFKTKYLELFRIEYTTKYCTIDELKNIINKDKDKEREINAKNVENKEKIDEKEKILRVDMSNSDYQIEEYKFFEKLSKKFEKVNKIIIEDEDNSNKEKGITKSLIRYILLNKKPISNKIEVNVGCKEDLNEKIKKNSNIPEFLIDYVDKYNYVNFLNLHKLKKDELFIEKNDIFILIDSKCFIDKK